MSLFGKFDRMKNPISHTAALTTTVCLLVVGSMTYIGLNDPERWGRVGWTGIYVGAVAVVLCSAISYFYPGSWVSLVPLCVAGLIFLAIVVGNVALMFRDFTDVPSKDRFWRVIQGAVLWTFWCPWAIKKIKQFQQERQKHESQQGN